MNPWLGAVVALLSLALAVAGGWVVTRLVLRLASRSKDAGAPRADEDGAVLLDSADGPEGARARAALRGGTWIGLLERTATAGALLLGQPGAVAVIVAVKGLGRYPELRENPGASERFVIGTLASLTWAAAVGFLGRWLLTR